MINDFDTEKSSTRTISLPFPSRIVQVGKFDMDNELFKVGINISLLEAIKKIPRYTKSLKKLCTNKRKKLKGDMKMGRNVFALIKREQLDMLKKCRGPNTFTISCTIGKCTFDAMLYLGTSINVMPSSIYKPLKLGALEPLGVVNQLANRSTAHPLGILEDVLVQVSNMIFLVDFYLLDMKDELSNKGSTLILGKPFLKITRTKIDVHAGTLSMEFGDNRVKYNIFETMKHPQRTILFSIWIKSASKKEQGNKRLKKIKQEMVVVCKSLRVGEFDRAFFRHSMVTYVDIIDIFYGQLQMISAYQESLGFGESSRPDRLSLGPTNFAIQQLNKEWPLRCPCKASQLRCQHISKSSVIAMSPWKSLQRKIRKDLIPYTLRPITFTHILHPHGGARFFNGVSLDRGNAGYVYKFSNVVQRTIQRDVENKAVK
ncbi:hypothetical protein CR513_08955, partial [Mucuna pruriens]